MPFQGATKDENVILFSEQTHEVNSKII